jgi:hypothetical protein
MQENFSELPKEILDIATDEGRLPLPDGKEIDELYE